MNIHTALLKAADHIQLNPQLFDFDIASVPSDCGSPGCALGWVNFFLGIRGSLGRHGEYRITAYPLFDDPDLHRAFYKRMSELSDDVDGSWLNSAAVCATALRRYAHKYHPEQQLAEAA